MRTFSGVLIAAGLGVFVMIFGGFGGGFTNPTDEVMIAAFFSSWLLVPGALLWWLGSFIRAGGSEIQTAQATSEPDPQMLHAFGRLLFLFCSEKPESEDEAVEAVHRWMRTQPGGDALGFEALASGDAFALEVYRMYRTFVQDDAANPLDREPGPQALPTGRPEPEGQRERRAALIQTLEAVKADMRAKADRLGLRPEDMVMTSDGVVPNPAIATGRAVPDSEEIIEWSEKPGCFERHLQRKYNNPLFPPKARTVTLDQVHVARLKDQCQAEEFRAQAGELVGKFYNHFERGEAIPYGVLDAARAGLDGLLRRAAELGGDLAEEEARIRRLYDSVLKAMLAALSGHNEAQEDLREAERLRAEANATRLNPFVAQMSRPDGPIAHDEVVPALLSEDAASISAAIALMEQSGDSARLEAVYGAIRDSIEKAVATGTMTQDDAAEKLAALSVRAGS